MSPSLTRQRHQVVVDDVQPCTLPREELNGGIKQRRTLVLNGKHRVTSAELSNHNLSHVCS